MECISAERGVFGVALELTPIHLPERCTRGCPHDDRTWLTGQVGGGGRSVPESYRDSGEGSWSRPSGACLQSQPQGGRVANTGDCFSFLAMSCLYVSARTREVVLHGRIYSGEVFLLGR